MADPDTVREVGDLLVRTLGLGETRRHLDAQTELFGSLPELDSLAVLELVQALEDDLGVSVDDDEFSGDAFSTVGTLADFVDRMRLSVTA